MDLRQLTPDLAVAPQISPADVAHLAQAGFKVLINNRPDDEVDAEVSSDRMREAAQAAGMTYAYIPFPPGELSPDMVSAFDQAVAGGGPVLAYCRSGNRSTVLWAMTQAGRRPAAEIVATGARAGYDLTAVAPMLGSGRD